MMTHRRGRAQGIETGKARDAPLGGRSADEKTVAQWIALAGDRVDHCRHAPRRDHVQNVRMPLGKLLGDCFHRKPR